MRPFFFVLLTAAGCGGAQSLNIDDYSADCSAVEGCASVELVVCSSDCEAGAVADSELSRVLDDRQALMATCLDALVAPFRCTTDAFQPACIEGQCTLLDRAGNDLGRTTNRRVTPID